MTVTNANVQNLDANLNENDIKKLRKYPRAPRLGRNILSARYPTTKPEIDVYIDGICCLIYEDWNSVMKNDDQGKMDVVWEQIIDSINEDRDEKLIPNLPSMDITNELDALSKAPSPGNVSFHGGNITLNSGTIEKSFNKDNSDNRKDDL